MKNIKPSGIFTIESQTVNVSSLQNAIDCIVSRAAQRGSFHVFTLNLDHLVKLRKDEKFRLAYQNAEFITADGFPIVTLAGLAGIELSRTTGSDLVVPLCQSAARSNLSVFFFGTNFSTLCTVARTLSGKINGLDVCGIFSPPMGFSPDSEIADEAIKVLTSSGARICFLALSPPLQEIFAAVATKRTTDIAFVAVGAGLDFIAGKQHRCPPLLRRVNLEWAWRLATNPKRLGIRYFRCALLFAELLGRKALARHDK